jgi:hypothetical protein
MIVENEGSSISTRHASINVRNNSFGFFLGGLPSSWLEEASTSKYQNIPAAFSRMQRNKQKAKHPHIVVADKD